ncbi:MAG: N-acetyltransferase, partial [Myxococcota bacterium]
MIHEALLRGLPEGGVMWLRAAGRSLWPLLREGDSLRVVRVARAEALRPGDVAVVKLPSGILAAHLVVSSAPLQTVSTAGVLDPQPLEPLGRVTGFRRAGLVLP